MPLTYDNSRIVDGLMPSLDLGFSENDYRLGLKKVGFSDIVTFSRATGGGRFNASGQYEWLSAYQPRFDFDPVSGECRGILIEEQRTNLLLRSAEFDSASWAKTSISVVANAATAPDGTMTADKLVPNTSVTTHPIAQSVSISGFVSFSVFLKSGEYSKIRLQILGNGVDARADFDAATGLASAVVTTSGFSSPIAARIDVVGGGWYRCSVSGNIVATGIRNFIIYPQGSGDFLSAGDGTSGLYIWGAQLEVGAFPTSYIPTTTAQVTRAGDVCSVNNLSPWYRADEGTLMVEASTNKPTNALMAVSGGSLCETTTNAATIARFSGSNLTSRVSKGGTVVSLFGTDPYTARSTYKAALALKAGSFASSFNGGTLRNSSQEGVMPLPARLCVGNLNNVGEFLNGHIRSIRYIPRRVSDTDLQALTAL